MNWHLFIVVSEQVLECCYTQLKNQVANFAWVPGKCMTSRITACATVAFLYSRSAWVSRIHALLPY